jgi:hypothetical protein
MVLTEEEQKEILNKYIELGSRHFYSAGNRLIIAQAKKILAWGDSPCPHDHYVNPNRPKRACNVCWDELRKELAEAEKEEENVLPH